MPSQSLSGVLSFDYWQLMLPRVYEPSKVNEILDSIREGVAIGRPPAEKIVCSPNWPSAYDFEQQVSDIIANDLAHGRLHGPFTVPPYDTYIISPLGAFQKRDKTKIRVIHDLSYPHVGSVNSLIDPAEYSLQYSTVDNAVDACNSLPVAYMANIDLRDAYKAIRIRPQDWHLLGFEWKITGSTPQYYFSKVLTFGLRSAPALFDTFASALEQFMALEGVSARIIRYVDDFLLVGGSAELVNDQLKLMIEVSERAGFAIQHSKVVQATRVTEFLGIVVDLEQGILRVSHERLVELKALLDEWLGLKSCSKRKLLKLIGKLAFAARVVRSGRAFLGRLIGLAKRAKALHHVVRLSAQARSDINWWHSCIDKHNGTCIAKVDWSGDNVLHVYSDASNHGYGAVWGQKWFAVEYDGTVDGEIGVKSINWRELHAVTKALATWGPEWVGKLVQFHVDNAAAGFILNRLYTPVQDLMELVRSWCYLIESHGVTPSIVYISTHDNTRADLLSRGDLDGFLAIQGLNSTRVDPASFPYYDSTV